MIHFLLKSIVPARDRVNNTDQLLLRVIEPDIVQDRRLCIRNTEYRAAAPIQANRPNAPTVRHDVAESESFDPRSSRGPRRSSAGQIRWSLPSLLIRHLPMTRHRRREPMRHPRQPIPPNSAGSGLVSRIRWGLDSGLVSRNQVARRIMNPTRCWVQEVAIPAQT